LFRKCSQNFQYVWRLLILLGIKKMHFIYVRKFHYQVFCNIMIRVMSFYDSGKLWKVSELILWVRSWVEENIISISLLVYVKNIFTDMKIILYGCKRLSRGLLESFKVVWVHNLWIAACCRCLQSLLGLFLKIAIVNWCGSDTLMRGSNWPTLKLFCNQNSVRNLLEPGLWYFKITLIWILNRKK